MAAELAVRGTAFHTPTANTLEVLEDVVIAVDGNGTISSVAPAGSGDGRDDPGHELRDGYQEALLSNVFHALSSTPLMRSQKVRPSSPGSAVATTSVSRKPAASGTSMTPSPWAR